MCIRDSLYAVLRLRSISDLALGPGFLRGVLLVLGVLSLTVAAALTLTQRDYKRLLAYSSIEHMGLMAIGVAIGGGVETTAALVLAFFPHSRAPRTSQISFCAFFF